MKIFKIGDKVRVIDDYYNITCKSSNWEGVVTGAYKKCFDAETTKHSNPDEIGNDYYALDYEHFELIPPETIVITNDGRVTTAWLKQGKTILKTGVAKCSPDDEFNLETGAKLALERLFEAEEQKKAVPKYKVGDRVKIVKEKAGEYWNPSGGMDRWLGKTMTICDITPIDGDLFYTMKEDNERWNYFPWMIEGLAKSLVIKRWGASCGIVGMPTGLNDINGKQLFVGDIVRVTTDMKAQLDYMVKTESDKFQPNGWGLTWNKDGTDADGLTVEKMVDWTECKAGDELDNCRIIAK